MNGKRLSSSTAGGVLLAGEISVHRVGFECMGLTGDGIWRPPKDRKAALALLHRLELIYDRGCRTLCASISSGRAPLSQSFPCKTAIVLRIANGITCWICASAMQSHLFRGSRSERER